MASSKNLGSFDELHRQATGVFPMCFEGARAMVQKGLSSHFQVSHSVTLAPVSSGYRFGITYVGSSMKLSETESYPVLMGEMDAHGNTIASVIHQFNSTWRAKLESHIQNSKLSGGSVTLERRKSCSTVALSLIDPNFLRESGIISLSYLRGITDNLDVGVNLVTVQAPNVPGGVFSNVSYAARYKTPTWVAAVSLSTNSTEFSYFQRRTHDLAFGCHFMMNKQNSDAITTFAYEADLPEEGLVFRGSIDTHWTVGAVMEKRLSTALPFTLALSGMVNHAKNAAKFGIGIIIGWGWPEDVWFHVDKVSSAHVYLRLPEGMTLYSIPQDLLDDCCQLVKANSIEGNKMNNIGIVYTMWSNLKKTGDMAVGQVGFHDEKAVIRVKVAKRVNEIVNRLNKTEVKESIDYREEREARDARERSAQKAVERAKKEREKKEAEERERLRAQRNYEDVEEVSVGDGNNSDDFM